MASNDLAACELWDVTLPALPSRSRLYHLAPIGVGTPYVESLTGYVARLAEAHNVWPLTLVAREMLPVLGTTHLSREGNRHLAPIWSGDSRVLNGPWTTAADWTRALEQLTLRGGLRFLTLQPWAEVLTQLNLLRQTRAWCPACYEERLQAGQDVYEQLLWSLTAVTTCTRHHLFLCTRCPYPDCGQESSPLESRSRPGYCSRCERWLGIPPDMSPAEDEKLEAEETGWHMWMAENIGELLAVAPTLPVLPRRERITYAMAVCVEEAARGTESVLAQALGLRPAGAWEWLHTERTPRLDLLLRLCDLVGISLLDFLTAEDIHVGPLRTNRPWMKFSPQQRSSRRPFDGEGVRQALEEILVSEEQPPPSLCEVARRLDRQVSVLAVRFPDLCHAISARYMAYRTVRSKERIQQVCVEVRQAVLAVHAQGVYPSLTRVAGLLRAPRLIQIPEAQATWRETLQELGR